MRTPSTAPHVAAGSGAEALNRAGPRPVLAKAAR